jgi:hypothetical protein
MHFQVQADGTLTEQSRKDCANAIRRLAGKRIGILIEEWVDSRSLDQNDFYRARVLPHVKAMMAECGDTRSKDEWHEVLLETFAPEVEVKRLDGEIVSRPQRTRRMKKKEMADFITAILAECADRGYPYKEHL